MKGPTIKILNLNENPELRAMVATQKKREATLAAKALQKNGKLALKKAS